MRQKSTKTATKTAKSPRSGAEIPLGAHPGNTGGKKGRSGRKRDAFKEMCRELASSSAVEGAVRVILKNPKHPAFIGALRWASEYGYGKPNQKFRVHADIVHGLAERIKRARERVKEDRCASSSARN